MPTKHTKTITAYKCKFCKFEHIVKKECVDCERDCLGSYVWESLRPLIYWDGIKGNVGDSKWSKYCAICHKKVYEFSGKMDGLYEEPDRLIMLIPYYELPTPAGQPITICTTCKTTVKYKNIRTKVNKIRQYVIKERQKLDDADCE
jgi:hypothetical protein